ncbi:MAG: hypothetical protein QM669_12045 [Siphonobacter sp.]
MSWRGGLIILWFFPGLVWGQKLPQGKFLVDSFKIGKPFQYTLSYVHDPKLDIFFPDSTYDFTPFKLLQRRFFTTHTNEKGSLDSAVYTFVLFDKVATHHFKLPIYTLVGKDCTLTYTNEDSIYVQSLLKNKSVPTILKQDTQLIPLEPQINFTLYLFVILGSIVLGALINWLFGQAISRRWRQFQLWRRYLEFRSTYQRYIRGAGEPRQAVTNVERAVSLWKRYLERLEGRPFTTFTTKETLEQFPQELELGSALRETDAVVYGGVASPQTQESLRILRDLAIRTYLRHRQDVLNKTTA